MAEGVVECAGGGEVRRRDSGVDKGLENWEEWAELGELGEGKRLESNSWRYSVVVIELETEEDSKEEDIDMSPGTWKYSGFLFTVRSSGVWSLMPSSMALLTISDWLRVSRRRSNSSILNVGSCLGVAGGVAEGVADVMSV